MLLPGAVAQRGGKAHFAFNFIFIVIHNGSAGIYLAETVGCFHGE